MNMDIAKNDIEKNHQYKCRHILIVKQLIDVKIINIKSPPYLNIIIIIIIFGTPELERSLLRNVRHGYERKASRGGIVTL